uniref:Transmembrane protein 54a n=1 Tax=Oryzias latipes TaxID=8090 RepID=A0A3P9I2A5_ORYLA
MASTGICCANLKDNKALMKMGLALVLVGHVNFLLGGLVHGAVLRQINVHKQARTLLYVVSNVIAIAAGLVGIISGITAIVLSKNKRNRTVMWVLLFFSFLAGLLGFASALGLSISFLKSILLDGRNLLTHCIFSNLTSSSITDQCPFDPTRVWETTIGLWGPLIVMTTVQMVFSFRSFAVCASFLYLCPCRKRARNARRVSCLKISLQTSFVLELELYFFKHSKPKKTKAEQKRCISEHSCFKMWRITSYNLIGKLRVK